MGLADKYCFYEYFVCMLFHTVHLSMMNCLGIWKTLFIYLFILYFSEMHKNKKLVVAELYLKMCLCCEI